VSDFNDHQYKQSGHDLGDLVKIIFLKRRSEKTLRMNFGEAVHFIEGLIDGMLHDPDTKVDGCV
jgi:hypothetical protein